MLFDNFINSNGSVITTTGSSFILTHNDCAYKGGVHKNTKLPKGDGLDSHHMPADSINGLSRNKGPAIQMDPIDHRKTPSYGFSGRIFNKKQQQLLKDGKTRQVFANEIRGVRNAAREVSGDSTKYNRATKEMLKEVRENEIYDLNK